VTEPMYRQIADDLRQKIESGELRRGAQLPTEIDLREQYAASRNTVRDALRWLITRGLIETRPGQGTFVSEQISPLVTTLSNPDTGGSGEVGVYEAKGLELRRASAGAVRVEIQEAANSVATELRVKTGATVVSRHQQRFVDGTPWSLQTSFYPMGLVERGATNLLQATSIGTGTMAYLEEALGVKQAGWRDTLTVRAPDENESLFFKIPSDGRVAVIEVARTAFDRHGSPVRTTVTVYPADRNQFVVESGDVPPVVDEGAARPYGTHGGNRRES
jgi:GntR family transcriptional regulator